MRKNPFVWFEIQWRYGPSNAPQFVKNEYFYSTLSRINQYFIEENMTFEWKQKMIDKLVDYVGHPRKLTLVQKFCKLFYL